MLWFVDSIIAEAAISRKALIKEDQVEIRPEKVTASCLDPQVCLEICKKYFTRKAWLAVEDVISTIKGSPLWYCGRCRSPINDETESSIQCDSCLIWYHFKCINLHNLLKSKLWLCRSCHNNKYMWSSLIFEIQSHSHVHCVRLRPDMTLPDL